MTTLLTLLPAHIQFVDKDGKLTSEAVRFLNRLFTRVGGAVAPSIDDLESEDQTYARRFLLMGG